MRIAIIGTDGLPARYGGFETFVEQIAPRFAAAGHHVTVVGSSVGRESGLEPPPGVTLINLPMSANGIWSIPYDLWSFVRVRRRSDGILLLGVSAGVFVPLMKLLARRQRMVINVDGLESRRAKWRGLARRYLAWSERVAIACGDAIVSDNEGISEIVRNAHGCSPWTIAYGNDHVAILDRHAAERMVRERFGLEPASYCLSIARIEPENNILDMVEGFLRSTRRNYVIVGNFGNTAYGRTIIDRVQNEPRIQLVDAVYDPVVLGALRSCCSIYLHGHSVGGTNPSLVEMLPYGRPIIAFDCTFNRYTLRGSGAYFKDSSELRMVLDEADVSRYIPPDDVVHSPAYRWKGIAEMYLRCLQTESPS